MDTNNLSKLIKSFNKFATEYLHGGLADGKDNEDFDPEQMEMGRKVEMEHTDNPKIADEISRDHLEEIPDYYDRLEDMEEEAKK